MVNKFTALTGKSDEPVCDGGVSFAEVDALLKAQFSNSTERSQTIQRIADKAVASKREAEASKNAAAASTTQD